MYCWSSQGLVMSSQGQTRRFVTLVNLCNSVVPCQRDVVQSTLRLQKSEKPWKRLLDKAKRFWSGSRSEAKNNKVQAVVTLSKVILDKCNLHTAQSSRSRACSLYQGASLIAYTTISDCTQPASLDVISVLSAADAAAGY